MPCNLNDRSGGNRSSAHLWRQAQKPYGVPICLCIGCFNVLLHSIYPTLVPRSLFHSSFLRNFFSTSLLLSESQISPLASLDKFLLCLLFLLPTLMHCWGQHSGCYYKLILFFPELHTFACIDIINIHKS